MEKTDGWNGVFVTSDERESLRREYKDSVFRLLFNNKENMLSLYNAIAGKDYTEETRLDFTTIEDALFKTEKNDIAFLLENTFVVLLEHQSSPNKNMTIRDLIYYTTILQRMYGMKTFLKEGRVKIPRPEFIVLYNGVREMPDYQEMKLSDNFYDQGQETGLQLTVKVYNINNGRNPEVMKRCRTLQEYSRFVSVVREYAETHKLSDSVMSEILQKCREENILKDFLETYGTEVIGMLFEVLTEEEARELSRQDGFESGYEDGLAEGRAEGEHNKALDMAKRMKAKGFELEEIVELTSLPIEEIEWL